VVVEDETSDVEEVDEELASPNGKTTKSLVTLKNPNDFPNASSKTQDGGV